MSKLKKRVLKIVKETEQPVSVDYVRYHARTGWANAKSTLLELLIEQMINGRKSTRGWIFWPKAEDETPQNEESDAAP